MTGSPLIDEIVTFAVANGNKIMEISHGWSKVYEVVYMEKPMGRELRDRYRYDERLDYWVSQGSPHNAPDEGFMDVDRKIAITFPLIKHL